MFPTSNATWRAGTCVDMDGNNASAAILRISRRDVTTPDTYWTILAPAVDSGKFEWRNVSAEITRWTGGDVGNDDAQGDEFIHHNLWPLAASGNVHTASDLLAIPPTVQFHPRPAMNSLHDEETRSFLCNNDK